ncbi:adenosylmethionine decarboxylase [Candidatus Woesearchaeota archaeon]|nr:adenosylmethionine decarboxylase [Candidatus Woesearchaeota archaeon]|tara:strand:- start:21661 stop:22104 length:444 start_codon:yes stop_codon:yes gene_type:complete
MFGPHLTLDLYGCDKETLADAEFVKNILKKMPEALGMNIFSDPQVTDVPSQGQDSFDQGGVTGFVILVESHMAIHTFPENGYVSFDIFSCKEFDTKYAADILMKKLGAKKVETNVLKRGREFVKHYPRSVEKAAEIAFRERSQAKEA